MIRELQRAHVSVFGAPVLRSVDDAIFVHRYFTRCMSCTFCNDACCRHGVDIDEPNVKRILAHADALERAVGISRAEWFESERTNDAEFPGGSHTRTRVADGHCVFHVRHGRGCALHVYAEKNRVDYHELKPIVSSLFPLTFDGGLLHASNEIEDGSLICASDGDTIYRGARSELAWYFGNALVTELDALEERAT